MLTGVHGHWIKLEFMGGGINRCSLLFVLIPRLTSRSRRSATRFWTILLPKRHFFLWWFALMKKSNCNQLQCYESICQRLLPADRAARSRMTPLAGVKGSWSFKMFPLQPFGISKFRSWFGYYFGCSQKSISQHLSVSTQIVQHW